MEVSPGVGEDELDFITPGVFRKPDTKRESAYLAVGGNE
jgi:hypothetical protein